MTDVYRIIKGSSGSLMCPPGHPNLAYEVRGATNSTKLYKDPHTITSVDFAAKDESLPPSIRKQAQDLLSNAKMVRSEDWERHVYGYFHNCYSPDGERRNAGELLILKGDEPEALPERHAAYLLVKEYFPEATPRLDLIADASGGYGQTPCTKCGTALQYEAKVDRFAEAITCKLTCPKGGEHQR
jgi:hypothetical protein